MAKNKNKGFSVIEIVIAIAILTLLLTPIVNQLAQTMSTNRKAKEQQYAVENSRYVMEYFRDNNLETLGDTTAVTREVYPASEVETIDRECEIRNESGDKVADLQYTAYKYELNQVQLGSRNTKYNRYVVLDDLAIQLMSTPITVGSEEYSYRIKYDFTDDEKEGLLDAGYTETDDGRFVLLEDDDAGDSGNPVQYVKAVICTQTGKFEDNGIDNPNEINLGNMHDLDSMQVALITGNATNFDIQAEKELYSRAMDRLKEVSEEDWLDVLASSHPQDTVLTSYGYLTGLKKMTEIKLDEGSDSEGDYYSVNVNVYYENSYLKSPGESDKLEYNVFSQKFYYDGSKEHSCPDIYFEYQPFAVSYTLGSEVTYSANEYILIDSKVEDAKIYLYKPKWDMAYRYLNPSAGYDDETYIMNSADVYYESNLISDPDHSIASGKVNIYICNANDPAAADFKNTYIYTNLLDDDSGVKKVDVNGTDSQFYTNDNSIYESSFTVKQSSGAESKRAAYDFDEDYLKGIDDENNFEERLFTITVYLEPADTIGNSIVLNGAKGVD